MRVLVYLPLLAWLLLGPAARPLAERLRPPIASWWLAGLVVVFTGLSWGALGLLALDGALLVPEISRLGGYTPGTLRPLDPTDGAVAVTAGLLLVASVSGAVRETLRRVRALREAARMACSLPGGESVTLVDDAMPAAFAVPGRHPRVVVTSGMADVLAPDEYAALLAHERAHLTFRHHLFLAVNAVAAAANPLLRPAAREAGFALERWADEHAATVTGDRASTAAAVGRAALASSASRTSRSAGLATLAIGGLDGDARPGPVPRRVAALLAPPMRSGRLVAPLVAAFVIVVSACALRAAVELHGSVEIAQAVTSLARHAGAHHHG